MTVQTYEYVHIAGSRNVNMHIGVVAEIPATIVPGNYPLCGYIFKGPGKNGEVLKRRCGSSVSGRYVIVQLDLEVGNEQILSLCEVEVYESGRNP